MLSNTEHNQKSFCVPEKLYLNAENLISFVEDQIKYEKETGFYKDEHPLCRI